jgi:hypothetical protein
MGPIMHSRILALPIIASTWNKAIRGNPSNNMNQAAESELFLEGRKARLYGHIHSESLL